MKSALFCGKLLLTVFIVLITTVTKAQPRAAFSADTTKGCEPLVVFFTDRSTGNPTSWQWDLGNGNTSSQQNPATTYLTPGTYTVRLLVSNGAGSNAITKTGYITVYSKPVVDFDASQTGGCFPLPVRFTDKTNAGNSTIASWLWDFGDGEIDSVKNPSHIYGAIGNYNVSLQVKNIYGCTNTLTKPSFIQINSGVMAAFSATAPDNCRPPASVSFINQSTGIGALSYQWDFGDGQVSTAANPSHTYATPGPFTITLIAKNNDGCADTLIKQGAVGLGAVTAGFSIVNPVCPGAAIAFTNTSNPAPTRAHWDFGDSTTSLQINPVKAFAAAGVYPVKLVSDFGTCRDSITLPVTVLQKPAADFSATNNHGCKAPLTVPMNAIPANAASYKWLSGDGQTATGRNPVFTYLLPGVFDVTLMVTNSSGCTDTITKKRFTDIRRPQVILTNLPQQGCVPYNFQPGFSILTNDSITSYSWDFGDGHTATGASPVNIYTDSGTYTVKLVYTTASGCTDSTIVNKAVRVGNIPNPALDASPRISCAFQSIQFTDKSTGGIDSLFWQFGDGASSNARNPLHAYSDTGYFSITLDVTSNGCTNKITLPDFIYIRPPVARFADSSVCADRFTRWFMDESIGALSWSWDFGDGHTDNVPNPRHTYTAPGNYTVSLTVRNNSCEHSTQRIVKIIREKAGFSASDAVICRKSAVIFTGDGFNMQNIVSYNWDFGDGINLSAGNSITHNYQLAGKYSPQLIITDLNGCCDTLLKSLFVEADGPTAGFNISVPAACTNALVALTDTSVSDGTHPLAKWIWAYGDGSSDTLSAPPFEHRYNTAGLYTVTLTVTDSKGCTDTFTQFNPVLISKPAPLFSSPDTLSCVNKAIQFVNLSASNTPSTYAWRFGDGQTSAAVNPLHNYTVEGRYDITLTVTDWYGCVDSIRKTQYTGIFNPQPAFSTSYSMAACPPLVVSFSNQSVHFVHYEWDFGDGTRSAANNPLHFYTFPGKYQAKLTVTSPGGCIDSSFQSIVIHGPTGSFTYNNAPGCNPDTIHFAGTANGKASFTWDFGDGAVISAGDSTITHTYTRIGSYLPKMILTDSAGCRVPVTGPITIKVYGVNAKFGSTQQVLCDSGQVTFIDSSQTNDPVTGYHWDWGDGLTDISRNPSHFYHATGHYQVQLIVITQLGCTDTARLAIPFRIVQSPLVSIAGDTGKCTPALLQFNANILRPDTSALQWRWDFDNGSGSLLQNPPAVSYAVTGTYSVQLVCINSSGCADTVLRTVQSYPMPLVKAGSDTVICLNKATTLQASGADQYNWQPATGLGCPNCATTQAAPLFNTTYYLAGETQYGCTGGDSIHIEVKKPFQLQVEVHSVCTGESRQLNAQGAELYLWTPATGLSNNQINNPIAQPMITTLYRVTGRDNHNCFFDTAWVPVVVYPFPTVELGQDIQVSAGDSVRLKPVLSADVTSIKWQPTTGLNCSTCFNPIAKPMQKTTYKAEVTNAGGCIARDNVTLFVFCNDANIFMPNTFSPNSDGKNNYFYPRGRGLYTIKTLRIFNRWGEVVFERQGFRANEEAAGWDGKHRRRPAPSDVYVYTIEVVCENGAQMLYGGNVMLLR
jgi:gliding motility-associated-like protein